MNILIKKDVPVPVTCKTVRLRAAIVPGYDALIIGRIYLLSNSSVIKTPHIRLVNPLRKPFNPSFWTVTEISRAQDYTPLMREHS